MAHTHWQLQAHLRSCTYSDSVAFSYRHRDSYSGAFSHRHGHGNSYANRHCHCYSNGNCYGDAYAYRDRNTYTDPGTELYPVDQSFLPFDQPPRGQHLLHGNN